MLRVSTLAPSSSRCTNGTRVSVNSSFFLFDDEKEAFGWTPGTVSPSPPVSPAVAKQTKSRLRARACIASTSLTAYSTDNETEEDGGESEMVSARSAPTMSAREALHRGGSPRKPRKVGEETNIGEPSPKKRSNLSGDCALSGNLQSKIRDLEAEKRDLSLANEELSLELESVVRENDHLQKRITDLKHKLSKVKANLDG